MTTKQTIDGVPRELLEVVAGFVSSQADAFPLINMPRGLRSEALDQVTRELRALLDAPVCKECEGVGYHVTMGVQRSCWACKPAAQPHGEPVAWQYRVSAGPQTGWSLWHDGKGDEFKQSYQVETRPLYAEQPAPVAVVLPDPDQLCDAIATALGEALDCTRVWSAWGVGTMSEDDFVPVSDQPERLHEIASACLEEVARVQGVKP